MRKYINGQYVISILPLRGEWDSKSIQIILRKLKRNEQISFEVGAAFSISDGFAVNTPQRLPSIPGANLPGIGCALFLRTR